MASYHKWDVKNGFAYVLQFFSLISDGLGGVPLKNLSFDSTKLVDNHEVIVQLRSQYFLQFAELDTLP